MSDPDFDGCLYGYPVSEYECRKDHQYFYEVAKEWTRKYAS